MTTPRIYTYKVTFEEIPDWYWGVHKEEKYGEIYLGSPETHAWKWEFYTPHLQVCEIFPYTDEGWAEARKVEDRCILPDLNNPLCLNEHVGGLMSLEVCRRGGKKVHEEKDDLGRSVRAMKLNETVHEEKDEMGRSLHTLKLHEEKDEFGRSVRGVKNMERLHKEKDDLGRSNQGVKNAERLHEEKDDLGRSLHTLKLHKKKDEFGRSVHGVKSAERLHKDKDKSGRSVSAVRGGKEAAKKLHKQIWESTVDGFRCNAGNVARHNKANGWDPAARIKIS